MYLRMLRMSTSRSSFGGRGRWDLGDMLIRLSAVTGIWHAYIAEDLSKGFCFYRN